MVLLECGVHDLCIACAPPTQQQHLCPEGSLGRPLQANCKQIPCELDKLPHCHSGVVAAAADVTTMVGKAITTTATHACTHVSRHTSRHVSAHATAHVRAHAYTYASVYAQQKCV